MFVVRKEVASDRTFFFRAFFGKMPVFLAKSGAPLRKSKKSEENLTKLNTQLNACCKDILNHCMAL